MGEPTLEDARRRFFAESGFAPDGGYDDAWAHAEFGPVPYSVPNPRMRADALRVHDLHHPLTGYPADWRGEAKISAWEIGSGGAGPYPYAWFIALFGLFTGLLGLPLATWRAFVAGRSARNLYGEPQPMRWLGRSVSEARHDLGIGRAAPAASTRPTRVSRMVRPGELARGGLRARRPATAARSPRPPSGGGRSRACFAVRSAPLASREPYDPGPGCAQPATLCAAVPSGDHADWASARTLTSDDAKKASEDPEATVEGGPPGELPSSLGQRIGQRLLEPGRPPTPGRSLFHPEAPGRGRHGQCVCGGSIPSSRARSP